MELKINLLSIFWIDHHLYTMFFCSQEDAENNTPYNFPDVDKWLFYPLLLHITRCCHQNKTTSDSLFVLLVTTTVDWWKWHMVMELHMKVSFSGPKQLLMCHIAIMVLYKFSPSQVDDLWKKRHQFLAFPWHVYGESDMTIMSYEYLNICG